jgi:hypothetical protein
MTQEISDKIISKETISTLESTTDQSPTNQTTEISSASSIPTSIIDFVTQVERTYRGLGLPVLYGTLSKLANKSVLFISGRGTGKTRTIKCAPDIQETIPKKFDAFTLDELNSLCEQHWDASTESVHDRHFVFKVKDFSILSEYHRDMFLTVCSGIIADGEYRHVTKVFPYLNIEHCKLTVLIAIQPRLYSLMSRRCPQWENMSYDRFSKFLCLNPLRNGNTVEEDFVPTLSRKTPSSATLPPNMDLRKLVTLFRNQISEGRAPLYARDYAIAMARFQGRNEVNQTDIDTFHKLFSPYLESFSRLQEREDFEEAVTVSSGHMELLTEIGKHLEGITKQELCKSTRLTGEHIRRCARSLLEKELIREEDGRYHLSTELEQFFGWYKDTFSVQMSPPQDQKPTVYAVMQTLDLHEALHTTLGTLDISSDQD